ncbi:hypothetical protein [Paenibacillus sp. ACRRY]|uniref:hypothetical protein n=1 Tax=Paenibacillus sp. ACRRY TaxID=2918208 RepID=UPI001EF5B123|nr:hypothetical protein [Paenibacillus sp. ACRRY]MCG7386731.1 hypothetical protein [Paenibacillus sp. ACRRY]
MERVRAKHWFISVVLLMGLTSCSTPFSNAHEDAGNRLPLNRIEELREEYPRSTGVPPTINMREVSFREMMDFGEAVIVAEVVSELPNFSVDLRAEPGTPEGDSAEKDRAAGIAPYKPEFIAYKVNVHQVLTGEDVKEDTFLFYNADFAGMEPELKPGMRIVTVVKKGTTGEQVGGYSFTRYGTYYIVDGDYVLSAYEGESEELREFTEQTNGIQVDSFIQKIKELAHS